MNKLYCLINIIALGILSALPVFSQLKLSSLFSDNMVLQQQTEVSIWGWTKPGNQVNLKTSWNENTFKAEANEDGKWLVKIPTIEAGGPYEMEISDEEKIMIKNIMLGEVWLCSGQSNMEMPMKGFRGQPVLNNNETILYSKNHNIRLITIPRTSSTHMLENFEGQWTEASPKPVSEFSAVAYYFGKSLYDILDIPIGLIDVTWGGSCIQAWMSRNTAVPFEDNEVPKEGGKIPVENRTPTVLFNGMLNPVIGYGVKGCIWYQGETNYQEPDQYTQLFATMVKEWRTLWSIGEFPFYYVQIAPYDYARYTPINDNPKFNSAFLREAQLKAMDIIPNSGMAIILDAGDSITIHPPNKEKPGKRLAYWALSKTYGIEGIGYQSPTFKAIEIKDSTIIISFNHVERGITTFYKEPENFEIAGNDRVFYPAKAILRSKSVIVYSEKVKNPVAVRYAFKDYAQGDLFSNEGIPVSSFRTDNWDQ